MREHSFPRQMNNGVTFTPQEMIPVHLNNVLPKTRCPGMVISSCHDDMPLWVCLCQPLSCTLLLVGTLAPAAISHIPGPLSDHSSKNQYSCHSVHKTFQIPSSILSWDLGRHSPNLLE